MLFYPLDKTKTLKQQYPELNALQEFRDLTAKEEILVWLYSCKSSPVADIKDPHMRILRTIELMDGNHKLSDKDKTSFLSLVFSEKIKAAMDAMRKFDPEIRSRARAAGEQMFNNLMAISSIDISEYMIKNDGNGVIQLDSTAINNYTSAIQKVRDELPAVIKMLEDGFGISSSVSIDLASGKSAHQIFMERQKQNQK